MRVYHLINAEHGIDNIKKSRIKLSRYDDLNDPFELLAAEMSEKLLRNAIAFMQQGFNRSTGIISFSKTWKNPVLWSHYADKHRGIALGFDIPTTYAIPVIYNPSRIQVRYVNNDPSCGVEEDFADEMMRTKYLHWEYEKEVRMVEALKHCDHENDMYFKQFSSELVLKEVILGHKYKNSILKVRNLLKKLHPNAFVIKARLAFKSFDVIPDQRSVRSANNLEVINRYGLKNPVKRS